MLKFIILSVIVFLIVLFWEKISDLIFLKIKVRTNYIIGILVVLILFFILALLYF